MKYYWCLLIKTLLFKDSSKIKIVAQNLSIETVLPPQQIRVIESLIKRYFVTQNPAQAVVTINSDNYLGTFKVNYCGQITIMLPNEIQSDFKDLGVDLFC